MITIGFDKQCITPKLPIPLRGYAGVRIAQEVHDPALAGDNSLLIFLFTRTDGKTLLLYNYACHPTVTGPGNVKFSSLSGGF